MHFRLALIALLAALVLPGAAQAQLACATMTSSVAGCAKTDGTSVDTTGGILGLKALPAGIVGASTAAPHVA
ncbi:MAG: hypothetical protein KGL39_55155, partial [Patescibacteria group bacterium]|nr:hypothetical protein [Patescibacteria group bacterium]